ncbi:nuclease-related domain-containing protein [Paenibacillus glucanolyticus]|uniref:nuclease-related domain-containing protein n=1 Tax=Paenibacillus glucanolyticus TaxID=59843 RepID=UPI00128D8461|nr:nuclease-related domain-containing protein [Paenibacillus glucanolyticus]MPY18876.1 NERD domain-containing protein [Paenibacillus glucanolyticus]
MFEKLKSLFKSSDKPKKKPAQHTNKAKTSGNNTKPKVQPTRIGELGEHKINIQLDQLPQGCKYVSDLMVTNSKSRTGYSQIDHVVITPQGLFVIETKNYTGEIKGTRENKSWTVSNRFKMYNPFMQNYGHIQAIKSLLSDYQKSRYISLVSFTMRCRFSVDPELRKIQSDELIVYDVELSEYIQRKMNRIQAEKVDTVLTEGDIQEIYQSLIEANITDPRIRAEHVDKARLR